MTDKEILDLLKMAHRYADPERHEATESITMDATFPDLGIESVSAMSMAGFIEDELGADFPDDELALIGTVRDFVRLIRDHAPSAR
jgi:acyl carrier protein